PSKLEDIIDKALEKDRSLRYQHASEIRSDLQRLKRDTDTGRTALPLTVKSEAAKATTGPSSPGRHDATGHDMATAGSRQDQTYGKSARKIAAVIGAVAVAVFAFLWPFKHRAAPVVSSANLTTVAVLPFQNMSPDKDVDFLRLALPDEIATTLSYIHSLS